MKSSRGSVAALAFLLAIPLAALYVRATGNDPSPVLHVMFALGAALLAMSVGDFRTPRWITAVGRAATVALAAIFLLQGVSELVPDPRLSRLAFRVLGQHVETVATTTFLLWCVAVLVVDSGGWRRFLGAAALAISLALNVFAAALSLRGSSINAMPAALKLLYLLPFVWLLAESRRGAPPPKAVPSRPGHGG